MYDKALGYVSSGPHSSRDNRPHAGSEVFLKIYSSSQPETIKTSRPDLTWRDVQHIIVQTSRYGPLEHNQGWVRNGAGLMTNTRFGFGLMDAYEMVRAAERWEMVPPQRHCNNSFHVK